MFTKSGGWSWCKNWLLLPLIVLLAACARAPLPSVEITAQAEPVSGFLIRKEGQFTFRHCDGGRQSLVISAAAFESVWRLQSQPDDWPVFFRGYMLPAAESQSAELVALDQLGGGLEMCDKAFQGYLYRARNTDWLMQLTDTELMVSLPEQRRQIKIPVTEVAENSWQGELNAGKLHYRAQLTLSPQGCFDQRGHWFRWQLDMQLNDDHSRACAWHGEPDIQVPELTGQQGDRQIHLLFESAESFRMSISQKGRQRLMLGALQKLADDKWLLQVQEAAGRRVSYVWVLSRTPAGFILDASAEGLNAVQMQPADTAN